MTSRTDFPRAGPRSFDWTPRTRPVAKARYAMRAMITASKAITTAAIATMDDIGTQTDSNWGLEKPTKIMPTTNRTPIRPCGINCWSPGLPAALLVAHSKYCPIENLAS